MRDLMFKLKVIEIDEKGNAVDYNERFESTLNSTNQQEVVDFIYNLDRSFGPEAIEDSGEVESQIPFMVDDEVELEEDDYIIAVPRFLDLLKEEANEREKRIKDLHKEIAGKNNLIQAMKQHIDMLEAKDEPID